MNKGNRIVWIDYTKAFACFLVVLGHLLQSLLKVNNNVFIQFTNYFIYLFHMPLFICISGILYFRNKKEFTLKNYKEFEKQKILNLIIPYFTFYLIFLLLNTLFANSVNSVRGVQGLIGIFNNPISPFWYLYALLSLFIIIPLIEKLFKNNKVVIFIMFCILKIIILFTHTNVYFIDSIMSYGIYFYLGNFIKLNNIKNNKLILSISCIIYILLALTIFCFKNNIDTIILNLINIFFAISGTYISISIFKNVKYSKILDTYKNYTFQIYLLHTICAAGMRILMFKLRIYNYLIHLILGIIISIYAPVAISKISEKIGYTEFFFFPIKTINKYKKEVSK